MALEQNFESMVVFIITLPIAITWTIPEVDREERVNPSKAATHLFPSEHHGSADLGTTVRFSLPELEALSQAQLLIAFVQHASPGC